MDDLRERDVTGPQHQRGYPSRLADEARAELCGERHTSTVSGRDRR